MWINLKIVVYGFHYFNYVESIAQAFKEMGNNVIMFYEPDINDKVKIESVKEEILSYEPDLFFNFGGNYCFDIIDNGYLKKLNAKKIYQYADSIKRIESERQNLEAYDLVLVFEPKDIEYIYNKYGIETILWQVGAAEEIYLKDSISDFKLYDVCFVGGMTEERLIFMEEIAKWITEHKHRMIVYCHCWHNNNCLNEFISKWKFSRRYPNLVRYIKNTYIEPTETAVLYKQTKICLNKHVKAHEGMNYRTFEIMLGNNFVLCDNRIQAKDYGLVDGVNLAFYENVDECIEKIEYYLANENLRNTIADQGGDSR